MKIPTIVGIALLITLIASAAVFFYMQSLPQPSTFQISNLEVVNIGNTTATVIWETTTSSIGEVLYSETEPLSQKAIDNRDRRQLRPRLVHFVTLTNLKPGTKYFYKVKNDKEEMQSPLEFRTSNIPQMPEDELTFSFIKPLKGTILNTNLNPIDESLILVEIPGAQKLATFSSTAGNFVLPMKSILSSDLSQVFIVPTDTIATMKILKGTLKSEIKILISEDTVNLPPIPIGSNLDLSNFKPEPITAITFGSALSTGFDFNGDGAVNSLDLAMLRDTAKPGSLQGSAGRSRFDINGDGTVDQKDVDEFSRVLTTN